MTDMVAARFALKMFRMIPSSPLTAFNNFNHSMYTNYVLGQNFVQSEFLEALPQALRVISKILLENKDAAEKKEQLSSFMNNKCLQKVMTNWDDLEMAQKRDLAELDDEKCLFFWPDYSVQMESNEVGTKHFLRAQVDMLQCLDHRFWEEYVGNVDFKIETDFDRTKKILATSLSFHQVQMEREVTKGVDGCWTFLNMKSWPKPVFIGTKVF